MYQLDQCPCCGSKEYRLYDAVISPFIAEYVLASKPSLCHLARCFLCQHIFFIERFTDEESQILYNDYRDQKYFLIRHKHEFWYSSKANNNIDGNLAKRKGAIQSFLEGVSFPFNEIRSVLDWGGDKGQYFIDRFDDAQKYLYDISDQVAISGVKKVNTQELSQRKFDMIMLCHILEHLSSPRAFIQRIKTCLSPRGYVYIEIPYEPFSIWQWPARGYRAYLENLLNINPVFNIIDLLSLLGRLKFHFVPPFFGFIKLHEHINFYTVDSLESLLKSCGFEIVQVNISRNKNLMSGRNKVIQCLARVV
jgi:SAM-dependent methyltransferase